MNSVKTNQLILNPDSFEKRIAIPQEVKQESYALQTPTRDIDYWSSTYNDAYFINWYVHNLN